MKRVSSLDDLQYYRNELARLQRELNERREAEISQMLQSSTRNRKPAENGLDELSVLAENPSYMTTLNDVTEEKQLYAPTPIRIKRPPSISDLPDPRKYTQFTRHDGEGLPPTSSSKKSSSLKSKKEPSAFKILRMPSRQIYSPATQTFMETRKIKPKSKSKGGKNKTKKRKTKKTKKNKKNKK